MRLASDHSKQIDCSETDLTHNVLYLNWESDAWHFAQISIADERKRAKGNREATVIFFASHRVWARGFGMIQHDLDLLDALQQPPGDRKADLASSE